MPSWRIHVNGSRARHDRRIFPLQPALIHLISCIKTITINVSEPVYAAFQDHARREDRKASELIREAMEAYRVTHIERQTSLLDRQPTTVGGPIDAIGSDDDLLEAMLDDSRD